MKKNVKEALKTTLVLGGIVLGAGALIGVTSAITSPFIQAHSDAAVLEAINEVFPDADGVGEVEELSENGLTSRYQAKKGNDDIGWAYRGNGTSAYGEAIEVVIAIDTDYNVGRIALVSSPTTYSPTLESGYIDPWNEGDITLDDVSCGATSSAGVVRNIANAARNHAMAATGDIDDDLATVLNVIPNALSVGELETLDISGDGTANVTGYNSYSYEVTGRYEVTTSVGTAYAYLGKATAPSEYAELVVGFDEEGELGRVHMLDWGMNNPDWSTGNYSTTANEVYIGGINSGEINAFEDIEAGSINGDLCAGATVSASAIQAVIKACENHLHPVSVTIALARNVYADAVSVGTTYSILLTGSGEATMISPSDYDEPHYDYEVYAVAGITRLSDVKDAALSRIYLARCNGASQKYELAIAVSGDGILDRVYLTSWDSPYSTAVEDVYVPNLNNGTDDLTDKDVTGGATGTATAIRKAVDDCLKHTLEVTLESLESPGEDDPDVDGGGTAGEW